MKKNHISNYITRTLKFLYELYKLYKLDKLDKLDRLNVMIIGVDITMLVYAGSGVANYIYNFAKTLLEIDKKNEYRLFYSSFRRPKNFYYLEYTNLLLN